MRSEGDGKRASPISTGGRGWSEGRASCHRWRRLCPAGFCAEIHSIRIDFEAAQPGVARCEAKEEDSGLDRFRRVDAVGGWGRATCHRWRQLRPAGFCAVIHSIRIVFEAAKPGIVRCEATTKPGAQRGGRTLTPSLATDFESVASANSAIWAETEFWKLITRRAVSNENRDLQRVDAEAGYIERRARGGVLPAVTRSFFLVHSHI